MYSALYNPYLPDSGNGLGGFSCHDCKSVTRTEAGMKHHCWRVHGKKAQRDFSFLPSRADELVRSDTNSASTGDVGATSGGGTGINCPKSDEPAASDTILPEVRED